MSVSLRKPGPASGRVFRNNLKRAYRLLYFFDRDAAGRDFPNPHARVLLESAIIFAVAALDSYLHDLILEVVPAYGPTSSRTTKHMRDIANKDPGLIIRLMNTREEADRRAELHRALADSIATKSFHGPKAVQEALEYLDCQIAWQEFDNATKVHDTDSELKRITDLRHSLVHRLRGPRITRDEAAAALRLIDNIVLLINQQVKERHHIP